MSKELGLLISRNTLVAFSFVFLSWLFIVKEQDKKVNWAVFYSSLWVLITLPLINFVCIKLGWWQFIDQQKFAVFIPLDVYFVWFVAWGILPVIITKGKWLWPSILILFVIDMITMPLLEKLGILELSSLWYIGEVLILLAVYLPAHLWVKFSLDQTKIEWRVVFQIVIMGLFLFCILPYVIHLYFPLSVLSSKYYIVLSQLIFIISIPALAGTIDLVKKGKGTPFPYDQTRYLVQTSVYSYIRNPIQWSFTLLFIPLSILFQSYWFLIGSLISIFYTIGVANPQEYKDMEERFGKTWTDYKSHVPAWRFLWRPLHVPQGTVYFKRDCKYCQQVKRWFEKRSPINLTFRHAEDYPATLTAVTFVDHKGDEFSSLQAIICCLERVNLAWASLAWFLKLPPISFLLQAILDSMDLNNNDCSV